MSKTKENFDHYSAKSNAEVWPDRDDCHYLGRGKGTNCHGVIALCHGLDIVVLRPINSRGVIAENCAISIPFDQLKALAARLV